MTKGKEKPPVGGGYGPEFYENDRPWRDIEEVNKSYPKEWVEARDARIAAAVERVRKARATERGD